MAGPAPSPLERLLVERVVACWLRTQYADAAYARLPDARTGRHNTALKRQAGAQHRYLQAAKALATARKLIAPALSPATLPLRPRAEGRPGTPARHPRLRPTAEPLPVAN